MAVRRGVTFEQVREMVLALPGVVEGTSYGAPAFRAGKKLIARLREDDVLVLTPIDDIQQRFLMETQPQTYFTTDHYRGYPTVLVRLSHARAGDLRALIDGCWRALATKGMRAARDAAATDAPATTTRRRR